MKDADISNIGINVELVSDKKTVCVEIHTLDESNEVIHRFYDVFMNEETALIHMNSITRICLMLGGKVQILSGKIVDI
jgi:hypothetical protein